MLHTSLVDKQARIKILHSNLLSSNQDYSLFTRLLEKEDPTIVVLQEVNLSWLRNLSSALSTYKYRIEKPQRDNVGIAVYSRIPLDESIVVSIGNSSIPSIDISFSFQSKTVKLIATHPVPPTNRVYYALRNRQLVDVAERISRHNGPKFVVGDLNVSI